MANQNRIYHQDNFATNLTSNQSAGVTTTPLNSIPSVSAPFYLALDATNINGKFEIIYVTSKTATNVNHAVTSYAHTTAEEVRMVVPTEELDNISSLTYGNNKFTYGNSPRGFMLNGVITPSVASNNLTVAIKTLAGADPSATDPVYCRIGDTLRSITSALSVTKNAGTNYCNAGSAELATKEIDYFVYLGYNATDGVTIGFSRIPFATEYDDFSTTSTNEKYCAISTITNAAAGDDYECIGRFAATLSAGAGYTWSVPTFTNKNLVQRPIYETRWLSMTITYAGFSANPTGNTFNYRISGRLLSFNLSGGNTGTSNATTMTIVAPFSGVTRTMMSFRGHDNGTWSTGLVYMGAGSANIQFFPTAAAGNYTASGAKTAEGIGFYEI